MPRFRIVGDQLALHLNPLEKFGAFSRDIAFPLTAVSKVKVVEHPMPEWLNGLKVSDHDRRSPLRIMVLKKFKFLDGGRAAFVAVFLNRPAIVLDLTDAAPLRRIVVSHRDAEQMAQSIRRATQRGPSS